MKNKLQTLLKHKLQWLLLLAALLGVSQGVWATFIPANTTFYVDFTNFNGSYNDSYYISVVTDSNNGNKVSTINETNTSGCSGYIPNKDKFYSGTKVIGSIYSFKITTEATAYGIMIWSKNESSYSDIWEVNVSGTTDFSAGGLYTINSGKNTHSDRRADCFSGAWGDYNFCDLLSAPADVLNGTNIMLYFRGYTWADSKTGITNGDNSTLIGASTRIGSTNDGYVTVASSNVPSKIAVTNNAGNWNGDVVSSSGQTPANAAGAFYIGAGTNSKTDATTLSTFSASSTSITEGTSSITLTVKGSSANSSYGDPLWAIIYIGSTKDGCVSVKTTNQSYTLGTSSLEPGSYTIKAVLTDGRIYYLSSSTITLTVTSACSTPDVQTFAVKSGSVLNLCSSSTYGAASTTLKLANSQTGYKYQLYKDNTAEGSSVDGTDDTAIEWKNISSAGTYKVIGYVSGDKTCSTQMTGTPTVTVSPEPSYTSITASASVCQGSTHTISLTGASNVGTYQWKKGSSNVGSNTNSYTINSMASSDEATYTCNLTNTGCTTAKVTSGSTVTYVANPTGGTATAADSPIDYKTTTTISVSGYTSGATIADWEKSTTSESSGFSSLGSTANPLTTESLTGTTYYRAKITKNGCSSYSSVATVNVNDPGTTISVDVSAVSWTDVHIYYWSGGGGWPGENMTSIGGNIYTYKIEGSIDGFIINNNGNGDNQTVDVTDITLGETNCYTVNTATQDGKRTVTKGDCPSEFTSVTVNGASVCAGSTVTLTKSSTPSESVTWSFSSSDASVATVNSDGVVTGKAAGSVTITATASKTGYISKSATCTVTVNANPGKPTIISYDTPICSGSAPTFNVNSVDGMTYRMYAGESPSGNSEDGDGSEITVTASTINSNTTFTMRATNAAGCYTSSDDATVTVVAGVPTIATSGAGTAVTESGDLCDGSEITLTAPTAFTNSPTQYQWSINGGAYTSLSANNTKAYTISGTSDFTVNVKAANVCGTSDASPTTTFSSIGTKASIIDQPTNQTVCQNGISSGLSVMASGTNPTYQWYSYTSSEGAGESLIAGAENSSYTPSTTTAGTYYYACKVNACGSYTVRSNIVTFTVTESHVIYLKGSGAGGASATYPWEYMTVEVDRSSGKTTPSDLTVEFIETPDFSGGVAPNHSVTITDDNKYLLKSAKTVNDAHYYTVKAQDVSGGTCAASDASYNVYINSAPAERCGE